MSEAPKDPLSPVFDFGLGFKSAAERVKGESTVRAELSSRLLKYHVSFLDDCMRGILPNDLILLGAETGAGKTQLATLIAMRNALTGKRVHYFALEAEPDEIERRIKFMLLGRLGRQAKLDLEGLNYADWYLGRCEGLIGHLNESAEFQLATEYRHLHTYYRQSSVKFGHDEIRRLLQAIQTETDLVILDHLHYVDVDDENENRGFKQTLKMIRDVTLGMGKPMILVAHIRKRDARSRSIVPDLEMFHGSSDIIKIVTHAILLAPARCDVPRAPGVASTFVHVPKDRRSGATGLVALCKFHRSWNDYSASYTLGRPAGLGDQFSAIDMNERPSWAKHHKPLYDGGSQ